MRRLSHLRPLLGAAGIVWALLVGAGFLFLQGYEARPGAVSDSPGHWPADSRLVPNPAGANLVLLAHPRCPCTRASLAELERIVTRCQDSVTAHVLFLKPARASEDWGQTDLRRSAAAIPGVRVLEDEEGAEARFGAVTSGHALLYDPNGRLIFSGGITGSRGHQGDNPGRSAVISLLTRGHADRGQTSVFGCPLFDSSRPCDERAEPCTREP